MTAPALAFAYLLDRPLTALLNIVLLALGVATIAALLSFDHQFRNRLTRDAQGVDLVVGAKGSRLQLVLSAVYHIDYPTGNIRLHEARPLLDHPAVQHAVPLALGDSIDGVRVIGTTADMVEFQDASLTEGRLWQESFEATLGADAAIRLGLAPGDVFTTSHGLQAGGPDHTDEPYTVTGILAPTGGIIDRLVLTDLQSIWNIHDHDEDHGTGEATSTENHEHSDIHSDDDREITALLLSFKSPVAAITLAPTIDQNTSMMAASPAVETGRLFALLGPGLDVLRVFGVILMATAALGVFTALTSALEQRRRDISVLRTLGALHSWVVTVMLCEALFLTLSGTLLGFVFGHAALAVGAGSIAAAESSGLSGLVFAPTEGWLLLGAIATGLVAAAIPIVRAGHGEVGRILSSG